MRIPDHDFFIETVRSKVQEALSLMNSDDAARSARGFNISFGTLYKISRWRPEHDTSFQLRKLIDSYNWACNAVDSIPRLYK